MAAKEQKASVSTTTKLVKKLHADASLMSALPSTLMKKAEARGEFDTMVLSQVETILTTHLQGLQKDLDSAEEVKRTKDRRFHSPRPPSPGGSDNRPTD